MQRWHPWITALSLAYVGVLLAAAPGRAQTASGGSFGGGNSSMGSSGSFGGGSSSSGSFLGGGASSGGASFLGGSAGGSSSNGSSFIGGGATGGGTAVGPTTGGAGSTQVGATSFLGANYANPIAMGYGTGTVQTRFGAAMFTLTNSSRTSTASVNSANQGNSGFGAGYGVRRLPSYTTTLKFDVPPPPTALQVRTDLQSMVASSPQLAAEDSVRVLTDGPTVVLQGRVKDGDERRLVENMVRLTPGVNQVRNELTPLKP